MTNSAVAIIFVEETVKAWARGLGKPRGLEIVKKILHWIGLAMLAVGAAIIAAEWAYLLQ